MKMNVTLSAVLLTAFFTVAAPTKSNSQPFTETVQPNVQPSPAENGKPVIDLQTAYPRVYKKLVAAYGMVNNLSYAEKDNALYLAFKKNNQAVHSVYTVKGKLKYAVTSIGTALPPEVLQTVKDEFAGFTLLFSRHVQLEDGVVYHIILENCREYKVLNYTNGEIVVVKTTEK